MTLNGREVSPRFTRGAAFVTVLAGCATAGPWLYGVTRGTVAFSAELAKVPTTNAIVSQHAAHLAQSDQRLGRLEETCARREARTEKQFSQILAELRRR